MHVAAASYFPRESPVDACWQQEVWHCHEYKSRERCSSRASSPHLRFFHVVVLFFLRCRAVATAVAVARAASCGCQCAQVHLPKR